MFYSKCGKKCRIIAIDFCFCSACLRQLKVCTALTYFLFSFWFNLVQAQSSTSPPPAPSLLSAWPFSWPCYGWLPVWLAWPKSPSCLITIIFLTLLWLTSPMVTNEPSLAQAIKVMLLLLLWIFNHLWLGINVSQKPITKLYMQTLSGFHYHHSPPPWKGHLADK